VEAESAAEDLRAATDVEERRDAFADRAESESDGPSATRGGDLGFFARDLMVDEFSAAVFDADPEPQVGDIIGPVRTAFGWHVILFDGFRDSLDDRLAVVQAALDEEGADFATVASELSDGPEAADGGEIGWLVEDDLDDATLLALSAIEVGEVSEAIDDGDGYRIYLKLEEATRPLEGDALVQLEASAFADWYDDRYFEADDAGEISIDDEVFEETGGMLRSG
jgi:parvulin-like peptidyl-prolyl isomerase